MDYRQPRAVSTLPRTDARSYSPLVIMNYTPPVYPEAAYNSEPGLFRMLMVAITYLSTNIRYRNNPLNP